MNAESCFGHSTCNVELLILTLVIRLSLNNNSTPDDEKRKKENIIREDGTNAKRNNIVNDRNVINLVLGKICSIMFLDDVIKYHREAHFW